MAVTSGDGFQDALLVSLVFFSVRKNLFDELVEIRVRTKRPLRDELLAAGRALLVAGPQGGHDALGAEAEKSLFCSTGLPLTDLDGFGQHFQPTDHIPLTSAVD